MFRPDDDPGLSQQVHPSPEEWDPSIYLAAKVEVVVDVVDIFQPGDIELFVANWINAGLRNEQEEDEDWKEYEAYPLPGAKLISVEYVGKERPLPVYGERAYEALGKEMTDQIEDWLKQEEE